MKVAALGANWSPCAEPIDHTVVPATGLPSPSVQVKAVPPHSWTSIPRCRLYQACIAGASLALKKMPPMPVTRFMEPPKVGGGEGACVVCGLANTVLPQRQPYLNPTAFGTLSAPAQRWAMYVLAGRPSAVSPPMPG